MKNHNLNLKNDVKRRAYIYALDIIKFVESLPSDNATRIIVNQLIRSATSVGANIIEAQASSSKKDFINFYHHALKSANESKFWLCLLRDSKKADYNKAQAIIQETIEISNILGSSLLTMKGKK
ncbi:MAG: four helix bundle protein [Patescibacteria group bacterium]|nr:four helix bundle protein [Patescibacteria group bacterium]